MGYRGSRRYSRSGNEDNSGFLFIFGGVIVFFIALAIYHYFRKKKIRDYCEKNLLLYEENPTALTGYSEAFDVLNQGNYSYFSAGMYGKKGNIELNLVDFSAVTETGYGRNRRRHTQKYTLCQLYRKDTQFPVFFIRDENAILDTLGSMLGGQDIDFVEDKSFSNKFVLQGNDEPEIRKFFKQKVRSAFLKYHKRGYCYESKGCCLLLYQSGHATLNGRINMLNTALKIFNEISTTGYTNNLLREIPRNPKYYGDNLKGEK